MGGVTSFYKGRLYDDGSPSVSIGVDCGRLNEGEARRGSNAISCSAQACRMVLSDMLQSNSDTSSPSITRCSSTTFMPKT